MWGGGGGEGRKGLEMKETENAYHNKTRLGIFHCISALSLHCITKHQEEG